MKESKAYIVNDYTLDRLTKDEGLLDEIYWRNFTKVYLEGFTCQCDQLSPLHEADPEVRMEEIPRPCWSATAARVSYEEGCLNVLFGGTNHLVYVEDNVLVWACKNIKVVDWKTHVSPKLVSILNPCFSVGDFIDRRSTAKVTEATLRNAQYDILDIKQKDATDHICRSLQIGGSVTRPDKDEYFMTLAVDAARRATCKRHKIGAILVDSNNRVVSTGYNGAPAGMAHCLDIGCVRDELKIASGTQIETCRGIHAEQNALLQAESMYRLGGGTCYCVYQPCVTCAKLLINAGVLRVVYITPYKDELAVRMLRDAGVKLVFMENFPRREET